MIAQEDVEFLAHYGVKGMRWGVRRKRSGNVDAATRSSKAKAKKMNNKELREAVERLRLEQQFSELSAPKKAEGQKYAKKLLLNSGDKIVGSIATAAGTVIVGALFQQAKKKSAAPKVPFANLDKKPRSFT